MSVTPNWAPRKEFNPHYGQKLPMHLNVAALRQQTWRVEKFYARFAAFAKSIGCTFGEGAMSDEIMATDTQARKLAIWWQENAS